MAKITFGEIADKGLKWGYYGEGGSGKTTFAIKNALRKEGKIAFFDIEGTLSPLKKRLTAQGFDVSRIVSVNKTDDKGNAIPLLAEDVFAALRDKSFSSAGFSAIIIDSMTALEKLYTDYVRYHFSIGKNGEMVYSEEPSAKPVETIEAFAFGKGNTGIYETNEKLLQLLDWYATKGVEIHTIAHDCDVTMEDARGVTKSTQPRLLMPNSGKNSVRHRWREWLDSLGYVFRQTTKDEEGHVVSVGRRFIAFTNVGTGIPEMDGTFWAKSRVMPGIFPISDLDAPKQDASNKGNEAKKEDK